MGYRKNLLRQVFLSPVKSEHLRAGVATLRSSRKPVAASPGSLSLLQVGQSQGGEGGGAGGAMGGGGGGMRGRTEARCSGVVITKSRTASAIIAWPTLLRWQPSHDTAKMPVAPLPATQSGPSTSWKGSLMSRSVQPLAWASWEMAFGTCCAMTSARNPCAPSTKSGGGIMSTTCGSEAISWMALISQRNELT